MEPLVNALLTGTPIAILVALVGFTLQWFYTTRRDKLNDLQAQRVQALEQQKFEHQRMLEADRFNYEQQRWREDLGRELTMKLLEVRIEEHSKLWSLIEEVSFSKRITHEQAQHLAKQIRAWRYSRGSLLAESITRDAAFTFQRALWQYGTLAGKYSGVRDARRLLIQALRADIGLADDAHGKNIFDIVKQRQRIQIELETIKGTFKPEPNTRIDTTNS